MTSAENHAPPEHASAGPARDGARWPLLVLAAMLALVPLATGNLTGLGIGRFPLLYDMAALPRLVIAWVLTCAALVVWFAANARRGVRLAGDAVLGLLVALAAWAGVSAAVSPHRALAVLGQSERLEGVVTVALYALLYAAALQIVCRESDVRLLAAALGGSAVVAAAYGLLQFAGIDPANYIVEGFSFSARRAFATMGNPNFLAGLLVLALPCVIALALTARSANARAAWAAGALAVAAGVFVTFTRAAWLAAAIEVALLAVVMRRHGVRLGRAGLTVIAVAGLLLVALVSVSLSTGAETNAFDRLTDVASSHGSASERVLVLRSALSAAASRPLIGYGPDAFLAAFRLSRVPAYAERFGASATINNAHSWPLQYAATLGVPGALLLSAAIVLALVRSRRLALPRRLDAPRPLLAAVWIACLGFSVHMLLSVAVLGATVPFWVLLGALGASRAHRAAASVTASRVGVAVCTLALVASVAFGTTLLAADHAYLRSRLVLRGLGAGDATALARQAVRLNPLSVKYSRGLAELDVVDAEQRISSGETAQEVLPVFSAAMDDLDRTLVLDPNDYATLAWKASLQMAFSGVTGDAALARDAMTTARRAAALDRDHLELDSLLAGDDSASAWQLARTVPPLP